SELPAKVGAGAGTALFLPASVTAPFNVSAASSSLVHQLRLQVSNGTLSTTGTSAVSVVSGSGTGNLVVSGLPAALVTWLRTVDTASVFYAPADGTTADRQLTLTLAETSSGASSTLVIDIGFPAPEPAQPVQDAPRLAIPTTISVGVDGALNLGPSPLGLASAATGQLRVVVEVPSGSAGTLVAVSPTGLTRELANDAAIDARRIVLTGDASVLARFLGKPGAIVWKKASSSAALPATISLAASSVSALGGTHRIESQATRPLAAPGSGGSSSTATSWPGATPLLISGHAVVDDVLLHQLGAASGASIRVAATGDITLKSTTVALASLTIDAGGSVSVVGAQPTGMALNIIAGRSVTIAPVDGSNLAVPLVLGTGALSITAQGAIAGADGATANINTTGDLQLRSLGAGQVRVNNLATGSVRLMKAGAGLGYLEFQTAGALVVGSVDSATRSSVKLVAASGMAMLDSSGLVAAGDLVLGSSAGGISLRTEVRSVQVEQAGGTVVLAEQASGADLRIAGIAAGAHAVTVTVASGSLDVHGAIVSTGNVRLEASGAIHGRALPASQVPAGTLSAQADDAARSSASVQAAGLTLIAGDRIAARSAFSSSALPLSAFTIAATGLQAQAGRDLIIDNLSSAALSVTELSAGSSNQRGDISLRSISSASTADANALTVSGAITARGPDAVVELDAGGRQGVVSLGAAIDASSTVLVSSRQNLVRAADAAVVSARDIVLHTAAGSSAQLGSTAAPLLIDLQGDSGSLSGSLDAAARIREASGDLRLGGLLQRSADAGRVVRIEAATGGIIGTAASGPDLMAGTVSLVAQSGIGLAATATSASDALRLANAAGAPLTLDAQSSGGAMLIRAGDAVAVNAAGLGLTGSGALLIDANASISLAAAGFIRSQTGALSLQSRQGSLTFAAGSSVQTAGGTIDLSAGGDITLADDAVVRSAGESAAGADIRLAAGQLSAGGVVLSEVLAGSGSVAILAQGGSIADADGATDAGGPDIVASKLLLRAGEDVGGARRVGGMAASDAARALNALEISAGTLAAEAGASVRLIERDTVDLGSVTVTVARAGELSASSVTTTLNGLRSTGSGDVSLSAGSAAQPGGLRALTGTTVSTAGEGTVTLSAAGANARVQLADDVTAAGGKIILQATDTVDKLNTAQLSNQGDLIIRAANGLRIIGGDGQLAVGTIGRASSPGVLRIEGNQTIATGQRLALKLVDGTVGGHDRLQVTGTLSIQSGATLDVLLRQPVMGTETVDTETVSVVLEPGFIPQLKQNFALITAGSIAGRFEEGSGLFGFDDGSRLLQISNSATSLSLETQQRSLADLVDIKAHGAVDKNRLGMFFNSDYFGVDRSYSVGMMVTTADFLTVDGSFNLKNADAQLTLSDGTQVQARRWLIGGSNLHAFAGLNGPYRVDTNGDKLLSDETDVNTSAAGFELTGVDLGLSMAFEKPAVGSTASPRGWVSATATSKTAEEFGLPLMEAKAKRLSVQVNAGTDGRTVVDYKGTNAVTVATGATGAGTVPSMTLNFDGNLGTLVRAAADIDLQVADFFWVSGSVGFEKSSRDVVLADGTKVRADMLAFGGRDLNAFAGLNGPYRVDSNLDGKIDADDTPNGRAFGLVMEDVDFGVALFTPQPGQSAVADLKWGAATATAGRVEFVGLQDVTIKVSNIGLDINLAVGGTASADNDRKVIDFAGDDGKRAIDVINGPSSTIRIDHDGRLGQYVRATGDVELRVGDFFEVAGSLGFERRVQTVTLADGSTVDTELISVGGTDLSAFVGLGPYRKDLNNDKVIADDEINPDARGLGVSGVEFGLGLFQAKTTDTTSPYFGKRWTALTGSIERVDALVGLPDDIQLKVHSLGVDINLAHGFTEAQVDDKVIDFGTRVVNGKTVSGAVEIATGTGKSLQFTLDGQRGELIRAAGGMDISVAGFFHASGTLAIEKSAPDFKLADGKTVNTDMLSIGGTDLNFFVGVNGPYRVDTNGDGQVNLDDAPNPDAVGLTANGGEFGLVLADDKKSARRWIALEASAAEVALVGVPQVTAAARHIDVGINLVQNPLSDADSSTQVIDFKAKPFQVSTGYRSTRELDLDGKRGESIRASGEFEVGLGGFVHARGMLGFEKYSTDVKLADGTMLKVDALSFGGDDINVFAGVDGPYLIDTNADGLITNADTPNSSARGFSLADASFALAVMTPRGTVSAELAGATWLGLEAGAKAVEFVGGPDIDLSVKNLSVEANQVFGLPDTVDATRKVIDFGVTPQQIVIGTDRDTGDPARYTLDVESKRGNLLRAVGDVEMRVGEFFYVGGSLGFEKSTRDLVLADGSRISHDVLTVGGAELQAFAGINGGPLVDSNNDKVIDSKDSPGPDAVGFSLSGVEFGLVVASEREVIRSVLDQKLAWRDIAISPVRQVAVASTPSGSTGSGVWLSTDQGATWVASTAPAGLNYEAAAISADGLTIALTVEGGAVIVSTNGGTTWAISGARSDAYTDVAVLDNDRVLAVDIATRRDVDTLVLSGQYKVGSTILISGLSDAIISYRVVANDLSADGKGSKVRATDAQALSNIATKLRGLINLASGSNAIAGGTGSVITLAGKTSIAQGGGWYGLVVRVVGQGELSSVSQATGKSTAATITLEGNFYIDTLLTVRGIAAQDVSYKINYRDFFEISPYSLWGGYGDKYAGIKAASELAKRINAAPGSLATATASGNVITLTARNSVADGGGWGSLQGLSGTSSARVRIAGADSPQGRQVDALALSGTWAVGDMLTLSGIATKPVVYTVVANDLTANGDGTGGVASAEQVRANIAQRMVAVLDEPRAQEVKIVAKQIEYHKAVLKAAEKAGLLKNLTIFEDGSYSDVPIGSMTLSAPKLLTDAQITTWEQNSRFTADIKKGYETVKKELADLKAKSLAAAGITVRAMASGHQIVLYGKAPDTQFTLTAASTGKSSVVTVGRASEFVPRQGAVQVSVDDAASSAFVNRAPSTPVDLRNTNWAAVVSYGVNDASGSGLFAAAGPQTFGGAVGGLYRAQMGLRGETGTWENINRNAPVNIAWAGVAADATGARLLAAAANGRLYVADTSRAGWQWQAVESNRNWTAVSVSADGQQMAATARGDEGGIWVSSNGGASWRLVTGTKGMAWMSIALTVNGERLIAVADGAGIFTSNLGTARASLPTRIGIEADAGAVRLVGVDVLDIEVSDIQVQVNLPGRDSGQVVDFARSEFDVVTGPNKVRRMSMAGSDGELLRVAADVRVSIGDFVYLSGTAAFEKRDTTVKLADGSSVAVQALTIGASDVEAFAGVNGPYRVDSNKDGVINGADTRNQEAIGVSLGDADLALALFYADADAKELGGTSLKGTTWTAVRARATTAELVGVPLITLSASDMNIEVNTVDGLAADLKDDEHVIDFKAMLNASAPFAVRTGPQSTLNLTMDGQRGESISTYGTVKAQVGDFLSVSGTVGFEQYRSTVALTGGGEVAARLLVITGADVSARLATGADADAIGVEMKNLDFGLVLASAEAAGDARTWLSVKGQAESVAILGTKSLGVELSGSNVMFALNMGLGTLSNGQANRSTVDWSGVDANGKARKLTLSAGGLAATVIDFKGDV
ncbi:MAG: hypothetical protein RI906_1616, partial [Pseudomonadota bacterium]